MAEQEHRIAFTKAGLFDPRPADERPPLPAGFRLLQAWQAAFLILELYARFSAGPFFLFGVSWFGFLANAVFGPLNFFSILRRSVRLRSGAYIFCSLEIFKAVHLLMEGYLPVWQPVLVAVAGLAVILYLQLPPVVAAVPRVSGSEMKNRWLQRFQRTLNG